MPEHVHLLIGEPERKTLAIVLQMLKQMVARKLHTDPGTPFWQRRYYDFNVSSDNKRMEKLRYIHRNPVGRGLVEKPEDWPMEQLSSLPAWRRGSRANRISLDGAKA